jgi:hypothetical protein
MSYCISAYVSPLNLINRTVWIISIMIFGELPIAYDLAQLFIERYFFIF